MEADTLDIICELKIEGKEEVEEAVSQFGEGVSGLSDELNKLKDEPLKGRGPKKDGEDGDDKDKGADAAIGRVSNMISRGLVQGLKSGDVKGALEGVGLQMAEGMASSLVSKGISSILGAIPGFGGLLGGLFSFLKFQREGLVRSPTLALVGEREPEFIVTQERMMALLRGGRPGYGFGPGDFGVPNVNVAPPAVNVEVNVAPGVDADIQTAY
ncbi:MAG: hypothetical protein GTN49_09735, partial [candidate division Zixibacteria bacterium]|nr:hypothetical protein [candidate division Zixibacteria bacterium]